MEITARYLFFSIFDLIFFHYSFGNGYWKKSHFFVIWVFVLFGKIDLYVVLFHRAYDFSPLRRSVFSRQEKSCISMKHYLKQHLQESNVPQNKWKIWSSTELCFHHVCFYWGEKCKTIGAVRDSSETHARRRGQVCCRLRFSVICGLFNLGRGVVSAPSVTAGTMEDLAPVTAVCWLMHVDYMLLTNDVHKHARTLFLGRVLVHTCESSLAFNIDVFIFSSICWLVD